MSAVEQIGKSLTFDAFFVAAKAGKTGLTVTVDVYDYTRTKVVANASATEIGGGLYTYTVSSATVTGKGNYRIVFKTADTSVDQQHLAAVWVAGLDWVQYLDSLLSGIATSVWAVANRTLTTVADSAGITTLLSRLTAGRASNLDHLDSDVSSRESADHIRGGDE